MAIQSEFTRGHNSFSGVDIKAVFGSKTIGTLQGISYSVTREKAPIYTMGSADMRAVARGKRGIAGSLVFIQFDSEPLLDELKNLRFLSDTDDLRPDYALTTNVTNPTAAVAGTGSGNAAGLPAQLQESELTTVWSDQELAHPWYVDQIPPFDVVLAAANEYGAVASMQILGVELMNSGYGVSIDDIVSEHSYTFLAHGIVPWRYEANINLTTGMISQPL
jgi:hypothetical protein